LSRNALRDVLTEREWNARASGITITEQMATIIEEAWSAMFNRVQADNPDYAGHDRLATTKRRLDHERFSSAVKSNYNYRCAVCGLSVRDFLVAAHIVPWAHDESVRLDPTNGLCLCTKHDRGFELGYFYLDEDYRVVPSLGVERSTELRNYLSLPIGARITFPINTVPKPEFVTRHRERSRGRWEK
jgi:predicted restriction endonuclease